MEIERKFLVQQTPLGYEENKKLVIEQCYISVSPVIRLRKQNELYILTVKGSGNMMREEFELDLTEEQFKKLIKKTETEIIKKERYLIPLEGKLTGELDIYFGELTGLMTVEVEFETVEEAKSFVPVGWFGEEVTNDRRYKNSYLAVNGLSLE